MYNARKKELYVSFSKSCQLIDLNKTIHHSFYFYFKFILLNEKISKVLYELIDSKDIAPKAIQQWKTELSLHLDINNSVKKN